MNEDDDIGKRFVARLQEAIDQAAGEEERRRLALNHACHTHPGNSAESILQIARQFEVYMRGPPPKSESGRIRDLETAIRQALDTLDDAALTVRNGPAGRRIREVLAGAFHGRS